MLESNERDLPPAGEQAQTLLIALRNMIIPIAETVNGDVMKEHDLNRVSFGSEADEFLIALQKFIAAIVRPKSSQHGEAQVNPTGPKSTLSDKGSVKLSSTEGDVSGIVPRMKNDVARRDTTMSTPPPYDNKPQQPPILTKMLSALRQHVFDTMPIRLLCFGTHESQFNITLVEREKIYSDLAEKLQAELDENEFFREINKTIDSATMIEADHDAIHKSVSKIAQYAILSHTWLRGASGEVTYDNWYKGDFDAGKPGYQKLVNFCRAAADNGLTFGWMDTVCINKASSAELDESIRSMYKWYGNADICITYLAGTTSLSSMAMDPWFTRGWTLQELVAPTYIKFYDTDWNQLVNDLSNDKINPTILQHIESAAMITHNDMTALSSVSISRKMHWAARREVTRGEDAAYSLMGIFNVNISIAYGEGAEQAFSRLVKEILSTAKNDVIDVFNWAGGYETKNLPLIPFSPKAYLRSCPSDQLHMGRPLEPITITHLGLRIPVVLLLAAPTSDSASSYHAVGDYHATVSIQPLMTDVPHTYNLADIKALQATRESRVNRYSRMAFAILNCPGNETTVYIPKTCFAVGMLVNEDRAFITPHGYKQKISTENPIVFQLLKKKRETGDTPLHYLIDRQKLARHGMQQLNIIL